MSQHDILGIDITREDISYAYICKICDLSPSIRREIAANPNVSLRVMETLAADKDESVAIALATNPKAPAKLLAGIVGVHYIPHIVALHPNATPDMLKRYAQRWPMTHVVVALNPNTPPDVLRTLSYHTDPCVRLATLFNPNLPTSIMLELQEDPWASISTLAQVKIYYRENDSLRSSYGDHSTLNDKNP